MLNYEHGAKHTDSTHAPPAPEQLGRVTWSCFHKESLTQRVHIASLEL